MRWQPRHRLRHSAPARRHDCVRHNCAASKRAGQAPAGMRPCSSVVATQFSARPEQRPSCSRVRHANGCVLQLRLVAIHCRERLSVANRCTLHTRRRSVSASASGAAPTESSGKWAGLRVAYQVCVCSPAACGRGRAVLLTICALTRSCRASRERTASKRRCWRMTAAPRLRSTSLSTLSRRALLGCLSRCTPCQICRLTFHAWRRL